jgi:diadenosine tetraphosphate (Ap4A) HIT family hydrolase
MILDSECILCNRKSMGDDILYETDNFFIKVGFMLASAGHMMVISKKHYPCLVDLPETLYDEYLELCNNTESAINKYFGKTFSIDFGPGAQSINHQHTHFIPLVSPEYEIKDFIKEAIIPTKMKFEKSDLNHLKEVYEKEGDYIMFRTNGEIYVYHIEGKYDMKKHLSWRYFIHSIKGAKSVPLRWKDAPLELKKIDEIKRKLTRDKIRDYFKRI